MELIERWFHVAPDGGDGTLEAIYAAVLILAVLGLVFRRRIASFACRLIATMLAPRG